MRQLRSDGFDVRLIGAQRFGAAIETLIEDMPVFWLEDRAQGIDRIQYSDNEAWDAEATLSIIGRYPARSSWVVVDHYRLGEEWERIIREAGHRVLVIDDFRDRRHCADILVGDSETPFDPLLNSYTGKAHVLAGVEFALVDQEFAFSEQVPCPADSKKRLLVSYGGADPTDETTKALEAIRLFRQDGRCREWLGKVDVVVGHANLRAAEVSELAEGVEGVIVHVAPESLAPLMHKTDVFLTAGGNSMVEALIMRKPCLVTLTSDNQALMVGQLVEQRAIFFLGNHAMVSPLDVVKAMTKFLSDHEQFTNDIRIRPIFDHFGARRISAAIQSIPTDHAVRDKYSGIVEAM
jgi:UDP-2,4-diacetamido-2,4,6-trideoxy-beta-L-altropyranose hydrolase